MCNITEIEVRCEALENENQDKDWIISSASETLNVTDDRLRPNVAITVSDLSEFTNYTCYAVVINTGGESNPSEPVKLQTKEGLTSEPLNLNVSNVTSSGFLVTWEEPWKVPGILQDYSIVIEAGSALHFIPEECQIADSDEAFVNDTTPAGVMEYSVDSALAHYGYTIRVSASTGAGRGQESSIDVNTTAGGMRCELFVKHFETRDFVPLKIEVEVNIVNICVTAYRPLHFVFVKVLKNFLTNFRYSDPEFCMHITAIWVQYSPLLSGKSFGESFYVTFLVWIWQIVRKEIQ